jgi:sterol desaturase/sphingolipid hydroxylase (fatty acid hydroxylase superfamily)
MDALLESVLTGNGWRVWAIVYGLLGLRYLLIAGAAVLVFYGWGKNRLRHRKIQQRWPRRQDFLRELGYSFLTFAVFAGVAVLVLAGPLRPFTQIYSDVAERGWGYFAASLALVLVIHDAYFYWAHRLMHHPRIYRYVHLTHHRSTNPTPWAAFSFHPIEAVVEAGIIFFIAFLFPVHAAVILLFVLVMTIYNVYGHLGWELYPSGFGRHRIGRWINTSVSHNLHHQHARSNYGLYFLWWDRWFGTLDPDYEEAFDRYRVGAAPAR